MGQEKQRLRAVPNAQTDDSSQIEQERASARSHASEPEFLVPEGEYVVGFASEKRITFHRRKMWLVYFQIAQGDWLGSKLPCWWNVPDGRVRRSHHLAAAFVVATGLRPCRTLARRRPSWFLQDCWFRAAVRTVTKDVHGIPRPEEASYSRVSHLIERLGGTPPCLRERAG